MEIPGRIVCRVEGGAFTTKRDVVYRREGTNLLMDVYAPVQTHPSKPLPAIVFVQGGPIPADLQPPKEWPFFQSYGELVARSGLIGVTFNHRFHHPLQFPDSKADVLEAIEYVRAHATPYHIDADAQRLARIHEASATMFVREGAKDLPMLIARAGLDSALVNRGIDVFVQESLAANAFLDFMNHRNGRHGFDFLDDDERSRAIIASAVTFAKRHLA